MLRKALAALHLHFWPCRATEQVEFNDEFAASEIFSPKDHRRKNPEVTKALQKETDGLSEQYVFERCHIPKARKFGLTVLR